MPKLRDAQWGGEVCAICLDALSADTEVAENKWPFPNEHFLVTACVTGHVYHKGCLKQTLRANRLAPCPECRKPIFPGVKADLRRDTPAEPEARRQRKRGRESLRDRARAPRGQERWRLLFEPGEGPQNRSDNHVEWKFWLKGRVDNEDRLRGIMRQHFAQHMGSHFPAVGHWYQRLQIHIGTRTIDLVDGGGPVPITRVSCDLYIPAPVADEVLSYLEDSWHRHNYTGSMQRILGINNAAGQDETEYPRNLGRFLTVDQMHKVALDPHPLQAPVPFPEMGSEGYTAWCAWSLD